MDSSVNASAARKGTVGRGDDSVHFLFRDIPDKNMYALARHGEVSPCSAENMSLLEAHVNMRAFSRRAESGAVSESFL
jgi:hypothetical protein